MADIRTVTLTIETASGQKIIRCSHNYDLERGFIPDYREVTSAVFRQFLQELPGDSGGSYRMIFDDRVHGFRASCDFNCRTGVITCADDLYDFVIGSYREMIG